MAIVFLVEHITARVPTNDTRRYKIGEGLELRAGGPVTGSEESVFRCEGALEGTFALVGRSEIDIAAFFFDGCDDAGELGWLDCAGGPISQVFHKELGIEDGGCAILVNDVPAGED